MKWMLDDIAANENALSNYFPVNSEFPCEEPASTNSSSYLVGAASAADRLSTNDFG